MPRPAPLPIACWLQPSVLEIHSKQWQLLIKAPVLAFTSSARKPTTTFPKKWTKQKKNPPPFVAADLPFEAVGFMHALPPSEEARRGLASPFFAAFVQPAFFFEDGTCCFINAAQLRAMWKNFSARVVHDEERVLRPEERRGGQRYGRQRSFRDVGSYIPSSRALLEHVAEHGASGAACLAQLRLLEIKEQASPATGQNTKRLAWGLGSEKQVILLSLRDWTETLSTLFA